MTPTQIIILKGIAKYYDLTIVEMEKGQILEFPLDLLAPGEKESKVYYVDRMGNILKAQGWSVIVPTFPQTSEQLVENLEKLKAIIPDKSSSSIIVKQKDELGILYCESLYKKNKKEKV